MKFSSKTTKNILISINIILIIIAVLSSGLYSAYIRKTQIEERTNSFINTVESMKQVTRNYLSSERGYVQNWASYMTQEDMTLAQALEFLRKINSNPDRFAHIVDMDTYEAYSSYYPVGQEKIDTYLKYHDFIDDATKTEAIFSVLMQNMFSGEENESDVLGKYRLQETQASGIAVGTRVTLREADGTRDYLLLRIIPTEALKKTWVFPVDLSTAEVGIITSGGDYVIQSRSMKSSNFPEYIRGYNFQDDYNKIDELRQTIHENEKGTFTYQNFRGVPCLFYYSAFDEDSPLRILGMIETSELQTSTDSWMIVFIICGTLLVLIILDSMYINRINHQLRESARLANQASEAKTQFLSAMSHDIRTPMNAVLGMMDIAKKNADNADYVRQCLDKSMYAGRQLLTLINDVLDISQIESGRVILASEVVCLDDLIENYTEMLRPTMEQKNLEYTSDYSGLTRKYILADAMRLNQIFVNLISNAVKYTDSGGKIAVTMYEQPCEQENYTRLIFRVSDNGIGMSEEFQKNMYHSFARAVNTQINRIQGSGLGLSIVKQMVDRMQGTIDCVSRPGEGTTFTVTVDLPLAEKEEISAAQLENVADKIEGLHLLVAEDNDLNWEIIEILLSERGIKAVRAENGSVCVNILKEAPAGTFDAILMDVQMPVMNGREATQTIRALPDEAKRNIPIIAMTADAFAKDVQACLACGMNAHIAKPIETDKLVACLMQIRRQDAK